MPRHSAIRAVGDNTNSGVLFSGRIVQRCFNYVFRSIWPLCLCDKNKKSQSQKPWLRIVNLFHDYLLISPAK